MQEVIAVQKKDETPSGCFQRHIPGDTDAFVRLVDDTDAGIHFGIAVQHHAAAVGTSVIDTDGFPVAEALVPDTADAAVQEPLRIEHRYDDRDGWHDIQR